MPIVCICAEELIRISNGKIQEKEKFWVKYEKNPEKSGYYRLSSTSKTRLKIIQSKCGRQG